MIDIIPLNVTSIKVIGAELNSTIQKSSHHFEAFVADRSSVDQLAESKVGLTEIVGILKMLEMPGASVLAAEMLELLDQMLAAPEKTSDFALSALSHAFVGMPCYIEYVLDREQAIPALTLSFINELKTAMRKPITAECVAAEYAAPASIDLTDSSAAKDPEFAALLKRLRQMYQMGLVGLIREENLELKMQLMHRAMSRLAVAAGDGAQRTQWRLGEAVLEALMSSDLELNFTRKRTLSFIDAAIRAAEENADAVMDAAQLEELLYLVHLSACTHPAAAEVKDKLALQPLAVTDRVLQRERGVMQGPNADTIMTMVKAIKEELAQSKEVLEIAAQDASSGANFELLVGVFQRTSDILSVVGLTSPSKMLSTMKEAVQSWHEGAEYSKDQLLEVADGLLYVESTLLNLSRLDLNFNADEDDENTKRQLMAKSQLDEAETIVIKEAQAGIAQAKKDINSFIESNFDTLHIANVAENLVAVRGGVAVLKLDEAAAVLASCIKFIQATINEGVDESKAQSVLETMADALIALEYYLSEIELHGEAPANVLTVAEQSLAALGYPV